jgi:hypothetical protein
MSVPNYLKINKQRIKNLPTQDLGAWNANYDNKVFDKFKVVLDLRERFPGKKINRADIINLFRQDEKYLGFVATMVWGFINASRPRIKGGDRTTTNFYRALSHERERVEAAIEFAENAFTEGDYRRPFKEMMRGERHNIPGIDYRYYTKIFFFLGQANQAIIRKPLIFDKWTANAFFALLSQSQPDRVCEYFRDVKNAKNANSPGEAIVRSGNSLIDAYETFITLINEWSEDLDVSPDKLEEFIFGFDLRNRIRGLNPRIELWEIIDNNRHLVKKNQAASV